MKTWTIILAVLAFALGLAAPVYAAVTPWAIVQENFGTNCTIGRAVLNTSTGNTGSTVRSKVVCNEFAIDANLPAGRMGVSTYATDDGFNVCATSVGYVDNSAGTAVKSVTSTVYCTGPVFGWGYQRRKVGPDPDDWVYKLEITDAEYF